MTDRQSDKPAAPGPASAPTRRKPLTPAAERALKEAGARRAAAAATAEAEPEVGGRGGLDPARYGDWEKKGIAVDF